MHARQRHKLAALVLLGLLVALGDCAGQLQVIVAGPGDDQRAVLALTIWKARPTPLCQHE